MTDRNFTTLNPSKQAKKKQVHNKLDTHTFAERAKAIHGNKFDYSQSQYNGLTKPIKIICKKHGWFSVYASSHLKGSGCRKCNKEAGKYNAIKTEDFIARAKAVYGDRYDYSLAVYRGSKQHIKIICREHGVFEQSAGTHHLYEGCPDCSGKRKLTNSEFIRRSQEVHGDKFDYSLSSVNGVHGYVDIICPYHGVFSQSAKCHYEGQGCPSCAVRGGFGKSNFITACKKNKGFGRLYVLKCWHGNEVFYKIGITSNSVKFRYRCAGLPYNYKVVYDITEKAETVFSLEKTLHRLLISYSHKPKIDFDGRTECFSSITPIKRLLNNLATSPQLLLVA